MCADNQDLRIDLLGRKWACVTTGLTPPERSNLFTPHEILSGQAYGEAFTDYELTFPAPKEETEEIEPRLLCPQGVKDFCPSDFVDPPPPEENVTSNPLGECFCEGEIFLSEGCQYAFFCDSEIDDIGGEYVYCDDVREIH